MASADSQFYDLSDADIDSLIHDEIPKNTKKATVWGISVLTGKVAYVNFWFKLVKVFLLVVNSFASLICAVYTVHVQFE